jgi:hypothetical protein
VNCGPVLSFHVWTRCGLRPKARQILDTADWDMPAALAIDRVDQCVSPSGGSCFKVAVMTFSTCSSVTVRGRPGRGSSLSPSSRPCRNRDRHFATVALDIPRPAAALVTDDPSAQASTSARRTATLSVRIRELAARKNCPIA